MYQLVLAVLAGFKSPELLEALTPLDSIDQGFCQGRVRLEWPWRLVGCRGSVVKKQRGLFSTNQSSKGASGHVSQLAGLEAPEGAPGTDSVVWRPARSSGQMSGCAKFSTLGPAGPCALPGKYVPSASGFQMKVESSALLRCQRQRAAGSSQHGQVQITR